MLFGAELSQQAYDEVRPQVEKGLKAVEKILVLDPYIAGSEFGYADIFTHYAFNLANTLMQNIYDWDIVAEIPGLDKTLDLISSREISKQITSEFEQALQEFLAQRG